MRCLLDTHIWIWYLLGHEDLSQRHRDLIEQPESELWLSPISIWETALLIERKRLPLSQSSRSWISSALAQLDVREGALTFEISLKARELSSLHEDPADRFIAATAAVMNLTLLTADTRLLSGTDYQTA